LKQSQIDKNTKRKTKEDELKTEGEEIRKEHE
jgi:hypothetical protein